MPSFQIMTLELLENILRYSGTPQELGTYITELFRELFYAKAIALIQCIYYKPHNDHSHRVVSICPERRKELVKIEELNNLTIFSHSIEKTRFFKSENSPSEIKETLDATDSSNMLIVPLNIGSERVGILLLLDFMDTRRMEEFIKVLDSFSTVLALVLRISLLYENQEALIKERTKELSKSEKLFRSLTEVSPVGIFRTDIDGYILYVNERFLEITGFLKDELIEKKLEDLIYLEDLLLVREKWKNLIKDVKTLEVEFRLKKRNSEIIWLLAQIAAETDECDGVIGNIGTITDITERREGERIQERLEKQLRQSQKMEAIGTLAGGIAHDFNNILGAIIGYAELALDDSNQGSLQYENLLGLLRGGKRAKDLIRQILTFTRQREEEKKALKVSNIIKEVVKFLRASLPSTIDISHDIKSDSLIMADATQIHQVFMNLCTNSAYAMKEKGGVLKINMRNFEQEEDAISLYDRLKAGPYVKITVSDTGCGMDRHIQERIFEPYFTTKKTGEGTGLGLAVVHGIVKGHGGDITVFSETGKGSIFQIFLPRINNKVTPSGHLSWVLPGGEEKILFVDDEKDLLYVTARRLEKLGYKVLKINNPLEALDVFKKDPFYFDLILTDHTMPVISGIDISKEVFSIRPDIPVVLSSGYIDSIDCSSFENTSIKEFIKKPFDMEELARKVRKALEK